MSAVASKPYWMPALPLIAILSGIRPEDVVAHVAALVSAGFDAIEIPLSSPDWDKSIALAVDRAGARAWIGGADVLESVQVNRLKALGARLVTAPNTRPVLIRHAVLQGLTVLPGIATPSEAFEALEAGAHGLKVFPAEPLGAGFVRAVRGVLPPVPLYAVGGVTPDNLRDFLDAGCAGAGLGVELYQPDQAASRTEAMARAFVESFGAARARRATVSAAAP